MPSGLGDGDRFDDDLLERRYAVRRLIGVAEGIERLHRGVEPVGDLTEQRVVGGRATPLSPVMMKNWLPLVSGPELAIAIEPTLYEPAAGSSSANV